MFSAAIVQLVGDKALKTLTVWVRIPLAAPRIPMQKPKQISIGQQIADRLATIMGSWPFIIVQSIILICWIFANIFAKVYQWDPYPFILLNLALSFQSAYAAPVIMMSQNRQSAKDREMAEQDFVINMKAEKEIKAIIAHLKKQDAAIQSILDIVEKEKK